MNTPFGYEAAPIVMAGLVLFSMMCASAAEKPQYPPRRAALPVPFFTKGRVPERGCAVERESVSVELLEEMGVGSNGLPVTFGMPFPQGTLFDPQMVRILSPNGAEVPAQFTITCFWPDGSIKWMLVDFQATLLPKEKSTYGVEFGREVKRQEYKTRLTMEQTDDQIVVNTGPMQVTMNKKRFALFDEVRLEAAGTVAKCADGGWVMRGENGEVFTSADGGPVDVRVEEAGPLKIALRFEGCYGDKAGRKYYRHITRVEFFAQSKAVRVKHTHINDQTQQEFSDFRSLELPISLATDAKLGDGAEYVRPDDKGRLLTQPVEISAGAGIRLLQKDEKSFSISGPHTETGVRSPGAMLCQGRGIVAAAVGDFWQLYPKGLKAERGRLTVELYASLEGQDFYKSLPPYVGFFVVDGRYRFKVGMSRSHEIGLVFNSYSALPAGTFLFQAQATAAPPIAVLPSAWYAKTGALGPVVEKRGTEFNGYDELFERTFRSHMQTKEKAREYGLFNWGDWYGERGRNWGNNEYDLPHALFMQFARTGNRDYFRMALAGARHMGDVDCVHACSEPERVGAMHLHSVFHTGTWSEKDKNPSWSCKFGWETWAANGHTWSEGMIDAWWLTGDARVMECAQELGDHIAYGMAPAFKDLGTHERSGGWSLVAIMAIYHATYDPVHLDAARKIAEVALRSQKDDPRGPWPHPLPGYHCGHPEGYKPRCTGNMTWLLGILGAGLSEYYQETGDERTWQCLQKLVAWLQTQWVPADRNFTQSSCTAYQGKGTGHPGLTSPPIACVWSRTQDPKLLDILAQGFVTDMITHTSSFGKSFAQATRWAPPVMDCLDRARERTPSVMEAMTGSLLDLEIARLAKVPPLTEMRLRDPELKVIYLRNETGDAFKLTAVRTPHGARTKEAPSGTIALFAPNNLKMKEESYDTDNARTISWELPSSPKWVYRLEIKDDMRAIWDVKTTLPKIVIAMRPIGSIGGFGGPAAKRCFFFVPQGTRQFKVGFSSGHTGSYLCAVQAPDGAVAGAAAFEKTSLPSAGSTWIAVQPKAELTAKAWSFIASGRGDISVKFEGIPPYYALSPDSLFSPGE